MNSGRRLRRAAVMGCDSADGTFLRWAPRENVPRMRAWLASLDANPVLDLEASFIDLLDEPEYIVADTDKRA